jgi:hypothetical protein
LFFTLLATAAEATIVGGIFGKVLRLNMFTEKPINSLKKLVVTVIVLLHHQNGGCSVVAAAAAFAATLIQGSKQKLHEKSFGCCGEN